MAGRSPDIFPPEPQQDISHWIVRHPDASVAVEVRIEDEDGNPAEYIVDTAWQNDVSTVAVSPDGTVEENIQTYSYGIGPHQLAFPEGLTDDQRFIHAYEIGTAILIGLKNW